MRARLKAHRGFRAAPRGTGLDLVPPRHKGKSPAYPVGYAGEVLFKLHLEGNPTVHVEALAGMASIYTKGADSKKL